MAPASLESLKLKSKNLELPEQQAIFCAEVSGVLRLLCHQTSVIFKKRGVLYTFCAWPSNAIALT
jgi:hypothetical protein